MEGNSQGHLIGIQKLICAQERLATLGGLRQAAFLVGLRQEIFMAFVSQRPVRVSLEYCNIDRSLSSADDTTWAFRIIVHCVDILAFSFTEGLNTVIRHQALMAYTEEWATAKPSLFDPIFFREPNAAEGNPFPTIWYHLDSHGKSFQVDPSAAC